MFAYGEIQIRKQYFHCEPLHKLTNQSTLGKELVSILKANHNKHTVQSWNKMH